ncbi:MAG: sn-glycerol-3-phosphate ABC transporter ATP-binding protein UgpC [Bacteroidota bacterium]|nr:sn-glycerol-3-phosphate ABC transporter ATP-binding protein UgpC [Bacteroidota bacterium]
MASVRLENIRKVYDGGVVAVSDVNVDINDKEFVVLVGPSGCGKTTTLRMIAGLEEISSGTISINGAVVNDVAPKDRDIAMVFQNYALYPHMTVYENMAFGLKLRKFPKTEIAQRVQEAAQILNIEEFLGRKPKALSGGQRQRVALGRAIVRKPKVFLFDEPLSNLDAKLRVQMRTEISKLHQRLGATMIYVTHDQTEAMTMGDRIVVMKDGIVQQINTPLNLYHNPANKFVAGFIGSPAMNFMNGTIANGKGLEFIEKGARVRLKIGKSDGTRLKPYIGKDVWLGVRPEHIFDKRAAKSRSFAYAKAKIDVVEPMGNEIYVYFTTGSNVQYVARISATEEPEAGRDLEFAFDMSQAHFFDKETENVI